MRIAFLGDIALFGCCTTPAYFKLVSDYLAGFDYVVGNLETPFSATKKKSGAKSAYICANPSTSSLLKLLHLNAVNLANNHMFDFGHEGYELTKRTLTDLGIEWFGSEGKELILESKGNRISFAGFCCYTSNPLRCVSYGRYGVNAYNLITVEDFIARSNKDSHFPVISVHAGLEHVNYPSIDHIKAARLLADVGPFFYYGHHPHVIQGVEEYRGSLIAHSLGNFCFDDIYSPVEKNSLLVELTDNNRIGMILELTIEASKLKCWREHIIHIGKANEGITLVDTPQCIREYNEGLQISVQKQEEYNANRNVILSNRLAERKSMRDISWYLKRLRFRYLRLVLDMKRNVKLYKENVKKYI